MHPDILRELADQRGREMHARARQAGLARQIRKAQRDKRDRTRAAAIPVMPQIPDYVDGTFRGAEPAGPGPRPDDERADGRRPAGHQAA